MTLQKFVCKCGHELEKKSDGRYYCRNCNTYWNEGSAEGMYSDLVKAFGEAMAEQKLEHSAAIRQKLWSKIHEKHLAKREIRSCANEYLTDIPDDFLSKFVLCALNDNPAEIIYFLQTADRESAEIYLDDVVYFIIRVANRQNVVNATKEFLDKFGKNSANYAENSRRLEELSCDIKAKIRNVNISRDVFVSYANEERERVEELVDYLEKLGLKCFVAFRNLPDDKDNFWDNIENAVANCKMLLLVSSSRSRNNDNVLRELGKYWVLSPNLSKEKKLCRLEYLLEDYPAKKEAYELGDETVKEYFSDKGYVYYSVGEERELAKKLFEIKNNGASAITVHTSYAEPTEYKREESLTEKIRALCINEQFDRAAELSRELLAADVNDMRGYMGLIRVATKDYTVYEGEQIDKQIERARKISRKNDLSEFDPDFADYAARRSKHFAEAAREEERRRRQEKERLKREAKESAERKRVERTSVESAPKPVKRQSRIIAKIRGFFANMYNKNIERQSLVLFYLFFILVGIFTHTLDKQGKTISYIVLLSIWGVSLISEIVPAFVSFKSGSEERKGCFENIFYYNLYTLALLGFYVIVVAIDAPEWSIWIPAAIAVIMQTINVKTGGYDFLGWFIDYLMMCSVMIIIFIFLAPQRAQGEFAYAGMLIILGIYTVALFLIGDSDIRELLGICLFAGLAIIPYIVFVYSGLDILATVFAVITGIGTVVMRILSLRDSL